MKSHMKNITLILLLILTICSTLANAQIEIGVYNKNGFMKEESFFPDSPQLFGRTYLLKELNKNLKNVKLMSQNVGAWRGINAMDDRISADKGTLFYFKDIMGEERIRIYPSDKDWGVSIPVSRVCGKVNKDKSISFFFSLRDEALIFAEYIYFFAEAMHTKDPKITHNDSITKADSIQFSIEVAKYREMSEKPNITEEQRKYIVQANAMNEKKDYIKAINYYKKALSINTVSYPSAYYNLALLYAQIENFKLAIINMKKYLALAPDAEDARKAKDKIYEWEIY